MERVLTRQQVAAVLGISADTISLYEQRLKLTPFKLKPNTPIYMENEVLLVIKEDLEAIERNRVHQREKDSIIQKRTRWLVLQRDGFKCCACGRTPKEDGVKLEVDHKISRAHGGSSDLENLWTLCFDCNRGKHEIDI
jgi:CO dehydrogenase/acetyl-CoA synthase alpha subunit